MSSENTINHLLPSVSVIIPTYNRSQFLLKAIRSVLNQTQSVLEILVCDDGSSDDSKAKVASLNSSKIKWIDCGKNGRPAIPRNIGISQSKGDWLAFLDDDDEWFPTKMEEQLQLAQRKNAKAICSNAKISKNGIVQQASYATHQKEVIAFNDLIYSNYVMCSSAMIHKSLLTIAQGFPEEENLKALEDYSLWLRVATQCNFYFVYTPLVVYNDAPAKTIRGKKNDTFSQRKNIFESLLLWGNENKIEDKYLSVFEEEKKKAIEMMNESFIKKLLRKIQ